MREAIIIDTDPGQDDAVALLLAFAARDRLDLRAITTVAGNVPVAQTTANALRSRPAKFSRMLASNSALFANQFGWVSGANQKAKIS